MATEMIHKSLLLLTAFVSHSHEQCFTQNDNDHYIGPSHMNAWIASRHNFSVSLMKLMNMEARRQNIIFSPSNIHEALLLSYFGAEKETKGSLDKVLQIPPTQNKAKTWRFYKNDQLQRVWKDIDNYPLEDAITLFMSNKLILRPCIEEKVRKDLEYIDFQTNVREAEKYINNWIRRRTHNRVRNYVHNLSPETTATIVNAVYLNGKWEKPFNPRNTQYKEFHINEFESRKISMMTQRDFFYEGYSQDLGARLLMLPYKVNTTVMIILLPDHDVDVMIDVMNENTLAYITDRSKYRFINLQIYVPKMVYKNQLNIQQVLETLGAGNIFTDYADFSGFTGRKDVVIKFGDHHAAIEVDEEGTKALETSEAKGVFAMSSPSRETTPFLCDRPFAYVIYDFADRKAIFMGTLRTPERK